MLYIGLDIHSKWMTIAILNALTGVMSTINRVPNDPEVLREIFGGFRGKLHGVMEAGTNAWAMYRILQPYFSELVVADPAKLWRRSSDRVAKTDKRDAERMALMLSRGEIEPLYIPDERTQDLRQLVRAKIRSSRLVTKLVNEIGGLLRSWGYVGSRSLISKSGRRELEKAELPARSQRVLELWNELLEKAEEIERELDAVIKEEAQSEPVCQLLETMPGVGPFTSLLIRAEIGDISRFKHSSELASYVGLTPRVLQSGNRCYYGRLGNWGNRWLKYAFGLLAQRIGRSVQDNPLKRTYWRVAIRRHTNAAKIAVARKAVRIVHQMMTHGEQWTEAKASARTKSAA